MQDIGKNDAIEAISRNVHGMEISGNGIEIFKGSRCAVASVIAVCDSYTHQYIQYVFGSSGIEAKLFCIDGRGGTVIQQCLEQAPLVRSSQGCCHTTEFKQLHHVPPYI